ncbi:hypothetical protein C8F04DRAFT_1199012 [Mycena alexandri]|uniref:Uncharacterized protein n=1 Tax=Mycena alexandri TaxID=1745969 RepID=A0AAD6RZF9_9AGAR|nr:hypothetical protein C8F04DRAFT_1199012 [Mycena alexandri]
MPYTGCSCGARRQGSSNWSLEPSELSVHQKTEHTLNLWTAPTPHSEMPRSSDVVDCTGNGQSGLKWLKAAGLTLSNDIRGSYDGNIRYVTVCFTMSPELADKLRIPEAQRNTMFAYPYMPHEDVQSSCLVNYHALQVKYFPSLCRHISGIPRTGCWVLEVIELLCEHGNPSFNSIRIASYSGDQSFIRYHCVPEVALPSNFITVGDATMQLNPMHGDSTRLHDQSLLSYYGSMCCKPMERETKDNGRVVRWLENKLISAASQDDEVASAFWHIRHMLAADRALLAPTILWKILRTRSLF